jgi:CSLREA domain-containing protein
MMDTRTTTKTDHYFRALMALAVLASMLVVLSARTSHASLFYTVNDTGDEADANPGDGLCDVQPSAPVLRCTLRAAIQESNANPTSPENIFFDIAGDGVHTISPASELPTITDTVTIDGYTQPGSSSNTLAKGTNTVLNIQLNGTNAGEFRAGLNIDAPNSVVKGLVINRFGSFGVRMLDGGSGSTVEGSFIGTNPSGTLDRGNHIGGVSLFFESANITVGGNAPAARNLISGNDGRGVEIFVSTDNEVMGNLIGTKRDGVGSLGNSDEGVSLFGSSDNTIGDGTAEGANTIAFNGLDGVQVRASTSGEGTGNSVSRNSIFSNGDLGIDLNDDGPTANDLGDPDAGSNNLQNKPLLSSAANASGKSTIKGKLNSIANQAYTVEFYSNPAGTDEGKKFIGQKSVTTDSSGNASYTFSPATKVPVGQTITATATNGTTGDASEFSAPRKVVAS